MNSEQKLPGFLATRSVGDRRNQNLSAPPYATGTGTVMIERRSGADRRNVHLHSQAMTEKSDSIEMPVNLG